MAKARELNELIRYTMWSVYRVPRLPETARDEVSAEAEGLLNQLADKGVVTRGTYDVSGFRSDADFMLWWVAPSPEDLQEAYSRFRRTALGQAGEPAFSAMALHRPAEFNKSHVPAFLAGEEPRRYACVYPYARSYDWYLLDPDERKQMLAEHGIMARDYPDVRANTVPCFALNDYEWMLCFEADELHRLIDLMWHLRSAEARRHTRLEIPFYTGPRKPIGDIVTALP